ncbi:GGDEF domain-containing protein [Candidatus Sulfurimonas marisnigri]|uniref:GGDEF domain-containing protein n=1 Tax=Candidatus Sulfurimonas marisnigri TaxID=2740405 RepID=A0A7S7M378_9BACT|nr:GGDEF domain-containing protein [Candidatus Sulfurimonas marisnigri]QOY55804.1 GGDEF domain-containing protein [Candidatus Sulfurimonas marisnigri]
MKQSIKNIFNNLILFLFLITILAAGGVLVAIDHSSTFTKIDNLNNQKQIISTLTTFPKDDIELALIQFNGKSTKLHYEIEKLRNLYKYNYTEQYVLSNKDEYLADLDELSSLTTSFNIKARHYYTTNAKKDELNQNFNLLYNKIDSIIFKSIKYSKEKFYIYKNITYGSFFIILLALIFYRKKLNAIYEDLLFLYNVNKKDYVIFSEEVDAIALRMVRKPVTSDNPSMIDPVTGINNHRGMVNSFSEKKGLKDGNFTTVTILEINNFSKSNRAYSQEFTQTILKKVAFTISLHEQALDVIARTDYNQFTVILSRESKEQSFKDIETIRQSISELRLKSQADGAVKITINGGFVVKPNNVSLENSIVEAKKVLNFSKEQGTCSICQIKDLAKSEL